MRPQNKPITRKANRVAAFSKIYTAPLETLTPAMVESIARTHERQGTPGFHKLLTELRATLTARIAREGRS